MPSIIGAAFPSQNYLYSTAQEVGVNLTDVYSGHLISREAGSVGGQMVKKMRPERAKKYEGEIRIAMGHLQAVQYIAAITV